MEEKGASKNHWTNSRRVQGHADIVLRSMVPRCELLDAHSSGPVGFAPSMPTLMGSGPCRDLLPAHQHSLVEFQSEIGLGEEVWGVLMPRG